MTATPSEIFDLAVKRHRLPWNWTLHTAALAGFALTLLAHSPLLFAASLIVAGAGFFEPDLPTPPDNRWFRLAARAVEWEKNWAAAPWNRHKVLRFAFVLLVALVAAWALWTRDPVVLALLAAFAYLVYVVRDNMAGGIDP
ncbi:hypothetical protein GM415_07405 [Pseudodesulfovibrio cashew]|uniref:Uncharacterized protein n=2 Tax=Pseudodesulfovibrio cashew TaxID=2678688 RepID=A0A6I6JPH3_9BACT|nr:hypothetical protein GM415_07405 [Pseudodesulfovibrio cashew]